MSRIKAFHSVDRDRHAIGEIGRDAFRASDDMVIGDEKILADNEP